MAKEREQLGDNYPVWDELPLTTSDPTALLGGAVGIGGIILIIFVKLIHLI